MRRADENKATLSELETWLEQIKRKLLGLRWDDCENRKAWESDKRRVERLMSEKAI